MCESVRLKLGNTNVLLPSFKILYRENVILIKRDDKIIFNYRGGGKGKDP